MKKIIFLSVLVLAFLVGCTGAEKKKKSETLNPELKGGVFLTSFYTAVEYNEIIVEDIDGNIIFEDDFSTKKDEWEGYEEWEVVDGKLKMLDPMMFDSRYAIYNTEWEAASITVKGTRVEGDEGICVGFAAKDENNFYQFNVGGWTSTKTALQKIGGNGGIMAEASNPKFNEIPVGEEVELRVELKGSNIKCYLNNELVIDYIVQ